MKVWILVKNFQGVNTDAEIYFSEKGALEEFKRYTGYDYNCPPHLRYPSVEDFEETKIFQLNLRLEKIIENQICKVICAVKKDMYSYCKQEYGFLCDEALRKLDKLKLFKLRMLEE